MTRDFLQSRWTRYGVAAAVGVILAIVRSWGVSETFQLFGDQMRDWEIALRPWRDLPLSGAPTYAGGRTWGPQYYWTLWVIRHAIGPFVHNLPHAGGIGQSILQSMADAVLLLAIWRRLESLPLALGTVLLIASYPADLALTATIWNPPVAVAYVKLTIAAVLVAGPSMWWAIAAGALAWFSVDVHMSAVFLAAPVMAAFVGREIVAKQWTRGAQTARALVEVVLLLEVPYVLDQMFHPDVELRPVLLASHVGGLHPLSGAALAIQYMAGFLSTSVTPITLGIAGAALALGVFAVRRDLLLASVTVLPLTAAAAMLAIWEGYFFGYWLLTLAPPCILTVAVALKAIPGRKAQSLAAIAFLAAAIAVLPSRIATAQRDARMPAYGPLSRGSIAIRQRTAEIADIRADFDYPTATKLDYIYTVVLGGRVLPASAPYIATIHADGDITYTSNPNVAGERPPRDR